MSRDCTLQLILGDGEPNEEDGSCVTIVEELPLLEDLQFLKHQGLTLISYHQNCSKACFV